MYQGSQFKIIEDSEANQSYIIETLNLSDKKDVGIILHQFETDKYQYYTHNPQFILLKAKDRNTFIKVPLLDGITLGASTAQFNAKLKAFNRKQSESSTLNKLSRQSNKQALLGTSLKQAYESKASLSTVGPRLSRYDENSKQVTLPSGSEFQYKYDSMISFETFSIDSDLEVLDPNPGSKQKLATEVDRERSIRIASSTAIDAAVIDTYNTTGEILHDTNQGNFIFVKDSAQENTSELKAKAILTNSLSCTKPQYKNDDYAEFERH